LIAIWRGFDVASHANLADLEWVRATSTPVLDLVSLAGFVEFFIQLLLELALKIINGDNAL
jgi:hypothetical protein